MTHTTRRKLRWAAGSELTEHIIYRNVARRMVDPDNRRVLERIAEEERQHCLRLESLLGEKARASRIRVVLYSALAGLLGVQFALKLMERGEGLAQNLYSELADEVPETYEVIQDEQKHEAQLLALVEEDHLRYMGSFVLGLNDALVELTGALAGLTLALRDTRLIAVVGLITGIAASMAMAASEYLATTEETGSSKRAIPAAATTGVAYLITVALLILPFLLASNPFVALAMTLGVGVLVVLAFTFYTAVAKGTSFPRKFSQMAVISLGVAALNFGIGFVIKRVFDV